MPRKAFERDLQRLQDQLLVMASMVESALLDSVKALKVRDMKRSRRLIADDAIVNEKRYAIESFTLGLIATQQPIARDLRTLAAILEIAAELERIGDYAKGIARINLMIGDHPLIKPLIDLPRMAEIAESMLHRSLDSFVGRDIELAQAIVADDDRVDELYDLVYRELMDFVVADQANIEQANHLLWAAHNLERAADRATNICERVIFTVSGKLVDVGSENEGMESLG